MSWKAIAESAKGTSHNKSGLPCQDCGSFRFVGDNILIGAVADGAGSAKHSDVGSKLAVEITLQHLEHIMLRNQKAKTNLSKSPSLKWVNDQFQQTLENVLTSFKQKFQENYEYSLRDLSCTLLAFIATPDWMAAMQIGDGFIVMRSQKPNSNYQLLFPPAKGEYANQTTFVTSASALSELQVRVISVAPKFIFAATDGLERMAIDFAKQQAYQGFFPPFENGFQKSIKENRIEEEEQDVFDWLNSEQVNSKTDDDKTILLGIYSNLSDNVNNTNHENESIEVSLVKGSVPETESPAITHNNGETHKNKLSSLNRTTSTLFCQAVLLNFLGGIFFHFLYFINQFIIQRFNSQPYNINGLIVENIKSLVLTINKLQTYYNILLAIVVSLVIINSVLTFFEFERHVSVKKINKPKSKFKRKLKKLSNSLLITTLALVVGVGAGWLFFYLIYLFVK